MTPKHRIGGGEVEVTITATETVRYHRTLKIPRAKFEQYEAMVERHQEKRVPDCEWENAFGDYILPPHDCSVGDGLRDLEIELVKRPRP